MTPDLSNELTIALSTTIVSIVLLALSITAIVFRGFLVPRRSHGQTVPLPVHYVPPYIQPQPLPAVGRLSLAPTGPTDLHQRRPSTTTRSSDEFPLCREEPTRNATPGPSNVLRTPPPLERPTTTEEYGRDLWTRYHSPSPPPYPTEPLPVHTQDRPHPHMDSTHSPGPAHRHEVTPPRPPHLAPASWPMATPVTRTLSLLSPDSDDRTTTPQSESLSFTTPRPHPQSLPKQTMTPSISTAPTTSGLPSLQWIDRSSDPTAPRPGSYEGKMSRIDIDSEKTIGSPWTGTSPSIGEIPLNDLGYRPRSQPEYSPIESEYSMDQQQETSYMVNTDQGPPRNSATWRLPYMHSPYEWETDPTWTESTSNQFDTFHYDEGTFSGYTTDPWDHSSYTAVPNYPFTLPDSPPHHQYAEQGNDDQAGGSNILPTDPPVQLLNEERQQQAIELAELKFWRLEEKCQELEEEQQAYDTHINYHQLPNKGKGPAVPRPPTPPIPNER
ncbi:hypothetical protein ARMSODRAFT_1026659 [Armillaria solidipes]|uniref:Uncharacterized protein n=1 Tax=Armillaria solidipes TaxID=1076256 RepID=A0A2H3BB44_9AGAR|nr:hypothetical protein ARMSODRAFT_1026659 [Armillaria solidipes]